MIRALPDVRLEGDSNMKPIAIDIVLGADGRLNSTALALAERQRRRVLRVCELTPGEEIKLRRSIGALTGDLLVGLTSGKRGGK